MTDLEKFRTTKDEFFAHDSQSPLTDEQRRVFDGLKYYPEDPTLALFVSLDSTGSNTSLEMQTSTGDVQIYSRVGRFRFEVGGEAAELTLFQGENGLFLPFVDSLAGIETYPAGRYLEPEALAGGRYLVDFNYAYNPYCAYNARWSCPLTPFENRIKIPIKAGEKIFAAEH